MRLALWRKSVVDQAIAKDALWLVVFLAPCLTVRTVAAEEDLSGGAIAGAVVGAILGAVLLCALCFFFCCRRRCAKFGDLERSATFTEGLVGSKELVASLHVGAQLDANDIEMQGINSSQDPYKAGAPLPLSVGVLDSIRSDTEHMPAGKESKASMLMRWLDDAMPTSASASLAVNGGARAGGVVPQTEALLAGGANGPNSSSAVPVLFSSGSRGASTRFDGMSDNGMLGCFGNLWGKSSKMAGVTFYKMPPSNPQSTAPSQGGSTRITTTSTYRRGPALGEGLAPADSANPAKVGADLLYPEEQGTDNMVVAPSLGRLSGHQDLGNLQGVQFSNVILSSSRRSTGEVILPSMPSPNVLHGNAALCGLSNMSRVSKQLQRKSSSGGIPDPNPPVLSSRDEFAPAAATSSFPQHPAGSPGARKLPNLHPQ